MSASCATSAAFGAKPASLPALPGPGELPPYTATQLGPQRALLARELRARLIAAALTWPDWIDTRPGRLQIILGDCSDPPLGASAAALVEQHGELLLDGIAALGLITAAPRLVLCASAPDTLRGLRALCAERSVVVVATPAVYPSCPEADVPAASGHAYTVPAEQLAAIGALLRGVPAPRLCTVAGAVLHPQVVPRPAAPAEDETPAALVQRCGGALTAGWVAVVGGALGGVLWPADAPLPDRASLCLILPVTHELVARLRRGAQWLARARNACLSCQACTDFCPVAQSGVPLFPHRLMRGLASRQPGTHADAAAEQVAAAEVQAAAACTGCGACSVMCPAELLPGAAVRAFAATLPDCGASPAPLSAPPAPLADRRVPLPLLLARLGLSAYS